MSNPTEPTASEERSLDGEIQVPISALEHYSYCPRQCALIHVEQTFDENLYTIRGHLAHERVESEEDSIVEGVRVLRAIPLWSERLGLIGKADVVEMRPDGPFPIEYKSGRPHGQHASLQLCGQALCLEEMLETDVREGAIYFAAVRRRVEVEFTPQLRETTKATVVAVRNMLMSQAIPAAPNDARCPNCSLLHSCMPAVVAERNRLRGFQASLFRPLTLAADGEADADA